MALLPDTFKCKHACGIAAQLCFLISDIFIRAQLALRLRASLPLKML
jgi:hypothetical protein